MRFALVAMPLVPCLVLATSGCGVRDEQLPDSAVTALEQAFNRGDVTGCAEVYTEDAEIIPEDGPVVRGRKGIIEFFKDQVARDISFDTDTTFSAVRGDLGVEQGTYRIRDVQRGVDVEYGDYLNVWRRVNGQWRAFRSMYNITMAQKSDISVAPDEEAPAPSSAPPP
jgi:ketosteroid isomerase-like protein